MSQPKPNPIAQAHNTIAMLVEFYGGLLAEQAGNNLLALAAKDAVLAHRDKEIETLRKQGVLEREHSTALATGLAKSAEQIAELKERIANLEANHGEPQF